MEPFIGQITSYGFNFNPRNSAFCAGGLLAINSFQSLFALIGTSYGGDGRTNFGLPDLRGRTPVNQGQHPGSVVDWQIGQQSGQERQILTTAELPAHTHLAAFTPGQQDTEAQVQASTDIATSDTPDNGSYLAHNDGGRNPGVFLYRPDEGNGTVNLGGVSGGSGAGGSVTVQATGAGQAFYIFQPTLAVNYCIALEGIFPQRD